jgi:hypothetical protein
MIKQNPSKMGVYITSSEAEATPNVKNFGKCSKEKFGFKTEKDLVSYISENVSDGDYFIVYMLDINGEMKIIRLGDYSNL